MSEYVFYCGNCHTVLVKDTDRTDRNFYCTQCGKTLLYTGLTKEEWEAMPYQTQEEIKVEMNKKVEQQDVNRAIQNGSQEDSVVIREINAIKNSVNAIKGMMIYFTVVLTIVLVIALAGAAGMAAMIGEIASYSQELSDW